MFANRQLMPPAVLALRNVAMLMGWTTGKVIPYTRCIRGNLVHSLLFKGVEPHESALVNWSSAFNGVGAVATWERGWDHVTVPAHPEDAVEWFVGHILPWYAAEAE